MVMCEGGINLKFSFSSNGQLKNRIRNIKVRTRKSSLEHSMLDANKPELR